MSIKFLALSVISMLLTGIGSAMAADSPLAVMTVDPTTGQPLTPEEQQFMEDNAAASLSWLKLIDAGNYAGSWDAASTTFKLTIKRDEWVKAMEKLRKPLGTVVSRTLLQQLPKQNPKGLPEGYYMVLVYQTDFSDRPKANELVTMILESDRKWRVLTYTAR